MEKILISACLVGEHCRYDGADKKSPYIDELTKYFELVPFCSEVEGGLETPRSPSEIKSGRVYNKKGENVTKQYNLGAEKALRLCKLLNIHICILKDKSPACGVYEIYDGSFTGKTKKGQGVTASLLSSLDFWVLSEDDIPMLLEKQRKKREIIEEKTAAIKARENGEVSEEGEESGEEKPHRSHYGDRDGYHKPYGERKSYGDRPYRKSFHKDGEEGSEDRPYKKSFHHDGDRPYRKSYGDKPYGERKSYGDRKPYGDKPYRKSFHKDSETGEERPYRKSFRKDGEGSFKKSYGERKSYGDKPYGERKSYGPKKSYGDKPYGEKKPYGDRKSYGDKKSYGDHKSYGDKKPYGRSSYGDKKPYSKEGSYGGSKGGFKKSYGPKKTYKKDSDD